MGRRKNDRGTSRTPRAQPPRRPGRPKVCLFCKERTAWVDYKDTNVLRRLMSDRGKIKARRVTGTCRQHQRDVATAIKTAREMALLPYVVRTASDRGPGRGGRGGGRGREQSPRSEEAAEPASGPGPAAAEASDAAPPEAEVTTSDQEAEAGPEED